MESMNHIPFSETNFNNGVWLLNDDQTLPIGYMQSDLELGNVFSYFYYWNAKDRHFYPIRFPRDGRRLATSKSQAVLAEINGRIEQLNIVSSLGAPQAVSGNSPTFLFYPQKLTCWTFDLIGFKVHIQDPATIKNGAVAKLNYTNEIQGTIASSNNLSVPLNPTQSDQFLVFNVRGVPIWSLGGQCQTIQISFPKGCAVKVDQAYAACIKTQMPRIKILYPGYDKDTGRIELSAKYPHAVICYDASFVKNCSGITLEIISPKERFRELNSPNSAKHSLLQLMNRSARGEVKLDRSMFANSGLYKVRLCPIDKQGNQTGFCSDHFLLDVLK